MDGPHEREVRGIDDPRLAVRSHLHGNWRWEARGEVEDQFPHEERETEYREEEDDERFPTWSWSLSWNLLSFQELLKVPLQTRSITSQPPSQPPDKAEQAEHLAESDFELAELLGDAQHGEERRVRGHEGAFEHISEAGEGADDGLDEGKGLTGT